MTLIRYADDFVVLHERREYLESILPCIALFLDERLRLTLHPNKVSIATLASGVDFLGWVNFPYNRVLRTTTKQMMMRKLEKNDKETSVSSYLGVLSHGDAFDLSEAVRLNDQKECVQTL